MSSQHLLKICIVAVLGRTPWLLTLDRDNEVVVKPHFPARGVVQCIREEVGERALLFADTNGANGVVKVVGEGRIGLEVAEDGQEDVGDLLLRRPFGKPRAQILQQ